MTFNTVGYLDFTIEHEDDRIFIADKDLRTAILNRLASMTDEELSSEIDWDETTPKETKE